MSHGTEKFCAWSGVVFVVLFFAGMIMAGLLPPPSPNVTAQQVADSWSQHTQLKRFGLLTMMISAGFQAPFGVLIAMRLKKIDGQNSPRTYIAIVGVGLTIVAVLLPVFLFCGAAYRPERSPEITQALHDVGWLAVDMNAPGGAIVCLAIAFTIFGDTNATKLWPRWLAYFNLYIPLSFLAGGCVLFFHKTAFAWNGLLGFWIGAATFGAWFLVMLWQLLITIPSDDEPLPNASVDDRLFSEHERAALR